MTSHKPIIVMVREGEDGLRWVVDVYSQEAQAEVKAFFRKLWFAYPADAARRYAESGYSAEQVEEMRRVAEEGVRRSSPFDPERIEQADEA